MYRLPAALAIKKSPPLRGLFFAVGRRKFSARAGNIFPLHNYCNVCNL